MTVGLQRSEVRALDLSAERIWPPQDCPLVHGWRCRLDRGVTRRANSVLAADWLGDSLAEAIEAVRSLYRERGLDPCFQITEAAEPDRLDAVLDDSGFLEEGTSLVMQAANSAPDRPVSKGGHGVELVPRPEREWLEACFGGRADSGARARTEIIHRIGLPAVFAAIGPVGQRQAVGVGLLDGTRGWINCMQTRPESRRQGMARAILLALSVWLTQRGAECLYLQVEADNEPARRLYEAAGFARIYGYHYRVER